MPPTPRPVLDRGDNPVTIEWLKSLGWRENAGKLVADFYDGWCEVYSLGPSGYWMVQLHQEQCGSVQLPMKRTREEMLALFSALEILEWGK